MTDRARILLWRIRGQVGRRGCFRGAGDPAWHPVLCTHFKLDFGQPLRLPRRLFTKLLCLIMLS